MPSAADVLERTRAPGRSTRLVMTLMLGCPLLLPTRSRRLASDMPISM